MAGPNGTGRGNTDHADDPLNFAPHSVEAEEATLGVLLMNYEAWGLVDDILTADDFFILRHGWIYEAMQAAMESKDLGYFDTRVVADRLRHKGRLEAIGGEAYLNYLPTNVPSTLYVEVYANLVHRAAVRRRMISAASDIAGLAHDEVLDLNQAIDQAEAALYAATATGSTQRRAGTIGATLDQVYDEVMERRRTGITPGVKTGLEDLDALLGGLQRSDLLYIAARPGMGKTALVLNIILNQIKAGERVMLFTMEMDRKIVVMRLIAIEAGIDMNRLRLGVLNDEEVGKLDAAIPVIRAVEHNLIVDDRPAPTFTQIRIAARRVHQRRPLAAVYVDYDGLVSTTDLERHNENEVTVQSKLSRAFKELARELHIPVVVVSQLSRYLERRQDKRPNISDLRSSGSKEQDADVVVFLYRDDQYDPDSERPRQVDLIVAKHRNGPTDTVTMLFVKEYMRFEQLRMVTVDLNTGDSWISLANPERDSDLQGNLSEL